MNIYFTINQLGDYNSIENEKANNELICKLTKEVKKLTSAIKKETLLKHLKSCNYVSIAEKK